MITFLIPLRSRAASKNWSVISDCFNTTLESCYNQTCDEFRIIVMCHDIPELRQKYDDRVKFVQVTIPTPTNTDEMMFDKAYKMYYGMFEACNTLIQNGEWGGI